MNKYKKIKLKNGKTIDEHRLIMQLHLGRELLTTEVVHHIDNNKLNNDISNLLITTKSEHMKLHILNNDIPRPIISEETKIKLTRFFANLSEEDAIYVKYSKDRAVDLMKKYNVSKYVISSIRNNKSWKHI